MALKACSVIATSLSSRKEGNTGSDFPNAGFLVFFVFFYPAHLFQMCYSDVDAEYVCSYYSLEGNLLCGVIDFYHFVSGVNTRPRFAVEYVPQARCNPWYTELKSDFITYYCTLYSHLNCGWVMKPLSLIKTGIRLQFLHSVICCFALIST